MRPTPLGDVAQRLLRGDGDASRNVVLDRQVAALKRKAHAILGELMKELDRSFGFAGKIDKIW